jgi:ATP-dependent DNA helicase RecG
LRNQHLANIFYRLRLIEAYGTGILKINECYDDYVVKPVIETTSNAFKITLPNTNFHAEEQKVQNILRTGGTTSMTKKEERINAVLKLCRSKGSIVRSDIEMGLGVSQSTAILLLRELTHDGVLIKKGKTKNLRYYENKKRSD